MGEKMRRLSGASLGSWTVENIRSVEGVSEGLVINTSTV
jgi:hypothetical protein